MADVMAVCERCGAFVQAAHVNASGLVSMDPVPTEEHWQASPTCRGAYGLMNVQHLAVAREMAQEARKRPKHLWPWYKRLRWWFAARLRVTVPEEDPS